MAPLDHHSPPPQDLERFIRLAAAAADTDTLVGMLAGQKKRIDLCRYLVRELSDCPRTDQRFRSACRKAGLTPKQLLEKLKPVIAAMPAEPPPNHYERLFIACDAAPDEIRTAFRRQAQALHPDHNPEGGKNSQAFIDLTAAYRTLIDPRRRAHYDRMLDARSELPVGQTKPFGPSRHPPKRSRFPVGLIILLPLLIMVAFTLDFIHRHGGFSRSSMVSQPSPPSERAIKTAVSKKEPAKSEQSPRTPLADDRSDAWGGPLPRSAANPVESPDHTDAGHPLSRREQSERAANAPRPKPQAVTDPPLSSITSSRASLDDARPRLMNFLNRYCRAYESLDLRRLAVLFHAEAKENGQPFKTVLPLYRSNLKRLDALAYRIELDHYEQQRTPRGYVIKGRFFARAHISNKGIRESRGTIDMTLVTRGSSFLVKRLDYAVIN